MNPNERKWDHQAFSCPSQSYTETTPWTRLCMMRTLSTRTTNVACLPNCMATACKPRQVVVRASQSHSSARCTSRIWDRLEFISSFSEFDVPRDKHKHISGNRYRMCRTSKYSFIRVVSRRVVLSRSLSLVMLPRSYSLPKRSVAPSDRRTLGVACRVGKGEPWPDCWQCSKRHLLQQRTLTHTTLPCEEHLQAATAHAMHWACHGLRQFEIAFTCNAPSLVQPSQEERGFIRSAYVGRGIQGPKFWNQWRLQKGGGKDRNELDRQLNFTVQLPNLHTILPPHLRNGI